MIYEKPDLGKKTEAASFAYQALPLLVIIILGFCLYSNTLKVPFVFDDTVNIEENSYLYLTKLDLKDIIAAGFSGPNPNRPIANISFALNYYFHRHNTAGYHITNTIIHILTAIFLYLFVKNTLKTPPLRYRYPRYSLIAFFAAAIWLVHPIQTQSVTYIVQRMTSLAAMFYILSLLFYVKGRLCLQQQRMVWPWFAGCVLSAVLAFGCKETAATLPVFIFLYEWYFFQDLNRTWLKRNIPYLTGVFFVFGLIGLWYLGSSPLEKILSGYKIKDFTLTERLLSCPRVMVFYIGLLVYPSPGRFNLDHDFAASQSLVSPLTTLPSAVVFIALIGLGIYIAKKERLLSFCIFWFFGNLVIESTVIALQLVFEHRLYLPSMFVSAAIAVLAWRLIKPYRIKAVVFCIVTIILCVWTYERNSLWRDPLSLWQDCVNKSPNKARARNGLGRALLSEGKVDEAAAEFRKALAIKPDYFKAHNNLGLALSEAGKTDEAIASFNEALAIKYDYYKAYNNLGLALGQAGKLEEAIVSFNEALKCQPNSADVYNNIGSILRTQGKREEAERYYRKALSINPDHIAAYGNLYAVLKEAGRPEEQIEYLRKLLKNRPSDFTGRYNLANLLVEEGRLDEAIQEYEAAIRINPNHAEAYNNLGNVLAEQGRRKQAIDAYRRALKLEPDYVSAHYNLAMTLAEQGKVNEAINEYREAIRLKGDYFNAHNNLAALLGRLGRTEEAVTHFTRALEIQPLNVNTYNNLGITLTSVGKIDEAIGHFQKALQIEPGNAGTHFNLAVTFEKLGKDDEAIAHYRQTLELNPNHSQARKRLQKAESVNE
ncbi:MAG: tetratricopeptide repeat protein [Planctomycetota bacterium]|jgi:tetratricopeptide (TPR) repeat protein